MIKPIEFTHSNYQQPVLVYPTEVFAVLYMPTMKSVALLAKGGAVVPVAGTIQEIEEKVTAAKHAATRKPKAKEA